MSLLRFKVFQSIFFKTATFFSIVMSAFLYAGNAYSADVTLAWDGVSQSGVSVTGYRVYYGTQNGSYPTRGCQVADTSCTVKELKDGQTYHFVARAYNSYGESGNSDPVSYTVPDALQTFTITASAGNDGSISPLGTVSVTEGQSKTFTISPRTGFHIDGVLVDGVFKGTTSTYTFNDIAANHTIAATFDAVTAVVPTDDDPSGSTSSGDSSSSSDSSGSTDTTSNSGVPSGTVIIDNGDSGTSAKGAWSVSAGTGPYGTDSLYSKTVSGTYSFETACTGSHEVYLWWTYHQNRYTAVPVQIYDGTELLNTVIVNQLQNGSQWNFLGTYTFSGTAKVVIVSSSSTESTSADAVKFGTASSIIPNDPSDPTSAGDATGSSSNSDSTDSTTATNPSGSSNTSASNGATTDNNSSIVTPAVTPAQEFVNQAPDQPGLLYPVEGAQDVSLTPLLEIAGFTDPDADDDHGATRWQIATDDSFEQLILDVTIDRSRTNNYLVNFLVPDGALCSEQFYYWRASVKDARDGDSKWSYWSEMFTFTTAAKVQADVNGNGVADDEEPEYSDLDNDGLNDNDQPLMRVYKSRKGQSLIGINAVEGVSKINCFNSIEPESIPDEPRPKLRYGLMVFNVTLDQIGGTARFELYLPEKPRIEAKWYKYDPINGWYEFPVDIVGDKYFIEITDGGFGDADGAENGIIVDPIGLAEMSAELESVDALDAVGSGDSESTMDRLKNACFIQVALDRPAVETTDAGNLQMVAFRFIYSGLMALVLVVAVIQVMGGRRGNRTHSSPRSNGRSRSA
ncbi:MAG: choice-of-anchor U domain-containing protein [Desulfobacterales bacterium]